MTGQSDAYYQPPDEVEFCEVCDDEGCVQCDSSIAEDFAADIQLSAIRDEGATTRW